MASPREVCDLNTQFTEHSVTTNEDQLLKNNSTRSVILCPFNTFEKVNQDKLIEECEELMEDKDVMIRFGVMVRELDRAYEKFNN